MPPVSASHWGAGVAAGLYLALGDEAEVPVPLVGSDALVAPRPATARSVTRQRAVGYILSTATIRLRYINMPYCTVPKYKIRLYLCNLLSVQNTADVLTNKLRMTI